MRFSTFAAFMLPLAALAAPTSTPPKPDSAADVLAKLEAARSDFGNSIIAASAAINATIDQLCGSSNAVEQAILKGVQFANTNVGFAFQAGTRIAIALQTNGTPLDSDQLQISLGTITAQFILKGLKQTVNDKKFKHLVDRKLDLGKLQSNICNAFDAITKTVNAGVTILTLQGKSVKGLFDAANIVPPPGF